MNNSKMRFLWALVFIALSSNAYLAQALPTAGITPTPAQPPSGGQLKGTAASCDPATASVDLDINNVRARMMNGGDMWYDRATKVARYEVPKGSNKNSLYAGSVWVGGYDKEKNLKVCAQTYRQAGNDYWPGPLDPTTNTIDKAVCNDWDKIWRINRSDLFAFRDLFARNPGNPDAIVGAQYDDIKQWPALGNKDALGKSGFPLATLTAAVGVQNHTYAPFVDVDGDGIYDWTKGDYPDILGAQYTWWVFNDVGNTKTETGSGPIGMEVQTSAFAFSTKDYLNDATFINYRLINRGVLTMTETYMATWTDADLGFATDDYIGCDTLRGLGILYNAKVPDGNGEVTSYGDQVPMVGVDFFIGPKHDTIENGVYRIIDTLDMTFFNYFNNTTNGVNANTDPRGALEYLRVMTGHNRAGVQLRNDQAARSLSTGYGNGPLTNFAFPGNPNNQAEWSQCGCEVPKNEDRRFVHSSGPFTLYSGGTTNDLTIGMVWVADVGGCPNATFSRIRAADDMAQQAFDDRFKIARGPDAPEMTVREGDRELIFYLTNNNPNSNNYKEQYGYSDSLKYHESAGRFARLTPDSLYKFEGYRIFQLKDASVTAAQIFGLNGEVNNEVAIEAFQTDIKNNVTTITNYENDPDKGSGVYIPQTKVKGTDGGIVHSFRLTRDLFAKGNDGRLVNYHNYYFIAIAYANNNYRTFSYGNPDSTQRKAYLESTQAWQPGYGDRLAIIPAMPNPTNGSMGTVSPDSVGYGTGVVIKRIEGTGSGNNFVQMDEQSEAAAMQAPGYMVPYPVYKRGQGPVNVKVIDPRNVKPYDWEIWLTGTATDPSGAGLLPGQSTWTMVAKDESGNVVETIYNERSNLEANNEQILAKYGIAVTIGQVARPGDSIVQEDANGYIGSSVSFADPGKLWLAGVNDGDFQSYTNWIRSGSNDDTAGRCNFGDVKVGLNGFIDPRQAFESLLSQNTPLKGTWAPYALVTTENRSFCGFGVGTTNGRQKILSNLPNIDVVFTSDKSKWTRCPVIELQDDSTLAEGNASKYFMRRHAGWNLDMDNNGNPVYSSDPNDNGMSWFPGYAINQLTGKRLNIIFGEDSYLRTNNGSDMIWNPTSTQFGNNTTELINGGKHYIYVTDSAYDEAKGLVRTMRNARPGFEVPIINAFRSIQWVGLPMVAPTSRLLSLSDGLIPTETRLRFRVTTPYRYFVPETPATLRNAGYPMYSFTTKDLVQRPLTDPNNRYANDKQALLDRIRVVPNPYYGYTGYENNRLDTRVRIVNLPNRATISIYSLDGTLVRRLEHNNNAETTKGFEDWDIRNVKGLQIASGMYLVHVKAEGIGETVIKWFGAMRPVDITTY